MGGCPCACLVFPCMISHLPQARHGLPHQSSPRLHLHARLSPGLQGFHVFCCTPPCRSVCCVCVLVRGVCVRVCPCGGEGRQAMCASHGTPTHTSQTMAGVCRGVVRLSQGRWVATHLIQGVHSMWMLTEGSGTLVTPGGLRRVSWSTEEVSGVGVRV